MPVIPRHPGQSLIELVAVVAILAVLGTLGLPALRGQLERQRVSSALHSLSAQFALARNTAVARGEAITVCPSAGDGRCRGDSDWSQGWLMYRNRDRVRPRMPGEGPLSEVLREARRPVHRSLQLYASQGRRQLRYLPDGRSAGSNLRVRVCLHQRLRGEVVVNNLGRVRSRQLPGVQACP